MFQTKNLSDQLNLILQALNHTDVGVSLSDYRLPDMPLVYINQAFTNITGYSQEEVVGTNCRFLQGDLPNEEARKIIKKALKNSETCQVILRNLRKNGEIFWNELHLNPILNDSGETTHYVGIQHDVTEREKTAESLRIRKELLAETNRKLRRLNDDKNRMMSTVAHDLRSPIANITALLELIQISAEKQEKTELTAKAKMVMARMNILVNDYLNFEAIQNGSISLDKTEVELKKFVIGLSDYLNSEAQSKAVSLEVSADFKNPTAFFDSDRMDQVVINLFSNALKFSEEGSSIQLDFTTTETDMTIKVQDQGEGIQESELVKIFDAFEKSSSRPTAGESGFGLGLSIVKKIVALHGGQVDVESQLGHGATFTVRIPIEK